MKTRCARRPGQAGITYIKVRMGRTWQTHIMKSRKTEGAVKKLVRHEDVQYFHDRAEQEIMRAQNADHPAAVQAHYLLAGYYLDMVHNSPLAPPRPLNSLQH